MNHYTATLQSSVILCKFLLCCSHIELRDWLDWRCAQTAEVQVSCLSPSAIRSIVVCGILL